MIRNLLEEHIEQADEATEILLSQEAEGDEPPAGFVGQVQLWAWRLAPLAIAGVVIGNELINGCGRRFARCAA